MKKVLNMLIVTLMLVGTMVSVFAMEYPEAFSQCKQKPMMLLIYADWADGIITYNDQGDKIIPYNESALGSKILGLKPGDGIVLEPEEDNAGNKTGFVKQQTRNRHTVHRI